MPKAPLDHLPKIARRVSVTLVGDDSKAEALEEASTALLAKETELQSTIARRVAAERASMPADVDVDQVAAAATKLREEDDVILEPFRAAVREAQAAVDEVLIKFTFRALPRQKWAALAAAHPPTEEDQAEWERDGGTGKAPYSLDGIMRPLIEASLIAPEMTPEAMAEMFEGDEWSEAELMLLRNYAVAAQTTMRTDPNGRP